MSLFRFAYWEYHCEEPSWTNICHLSATWSSFPILKEQQEKVHCLLQFGEAISILVQQWVDLHSTNK